MILVVAFAILLLFLGIAVAFVLFAAGRYGWKPVLQYLLFAVSGRIITHFALSERDQAQQTLIPLIAAGVIVWSLPHIMHQRDIENGGETRADESNDSTQGEA